MLKLHFQLSHPSYKISQRKQINLKYYYPLKQVCILKESQEKAPAENEKRSNPAGVLNTVTEEYNSRNKYEAKYKKGR